LEGEINNNKLSGWVFDCGGEPVEVDIKNNEPIINGWTLSELKKMVIFKNSCQT
jgi:hypothetical protein